MTVSLEINFTNNLSAEFYPTQVIEGTVELNTDADIILSGLRVDIKGIVESKWEETWVNRVIEHKGSENLLNATTYLAGPNNGLHQVHIPAGEHVFKFDCRLPESLPYSIEGEKGCISYKVIATLKMPSIVEVETVRPFTVRRHDDLRRVTNIDYRSPCEEEKMSSFCCFICRTDPLVMTMRIPWHGFGLGDKIPIQVRLVNDSAMGVHSTEFALLQVERVKSQIPVERGRVFEKVVAWKSARGARAGQNVVIDEILNIPATIPTSNDRFSEVYQLSYFIRFKALVPDDYQVPEIIMGITIGDIGVVDITTTTVQLPPDAANDLPPSFEEATKVPTFEEATGKLL